MKLAATIAGSIKTGLEAEMRRIERAVPAGVKDAGDGLKSELRRQVVTAGLGQRLARTWRGRMYPNRGHDAAALVFSKAPHIIRAFDQGAVIRSRRGRLLAIPTAAAPKRGSGGRRLTPRTFPTARYGPLRFVRRRRGGGLLVVDAVRISAKTGGVGRRLKGGAYTRTGRLKSGVASVAMFVLVPQVKLRKRLDVARAARRWVARLPGRIDQQLDRQRN